MVLLLLLGVLVTAALAPSRWLSPLAGDGPLAPPADASPRAPPSRASAPDDPRGHLVPLDAPPSTTSSAHAPAPRSDPGEEPADDGRLRLRVRFVDDRGREVLVQGGYVQAVTSESSRLLEWWIPRTPTSTAELECSGIAQGPATLSLRDVWRGDSAVRGAARSVPLAVSLAAGVCGPFDLVLEEPGPLTVQVRDAEGRPAAGLSVEITGPNYRLRETVEPTGDLEVAPAESALGPVEVRAFWSDAPAVLAARAYVVLDASPQVVLLTVVPPPISGEVVVTIVDRDGRPCAYDDSIWLEAKDGGMGGAFETRRPYSLEPRRETLRTVPGRYQIHLAHIGVDVPRQSVEVRSGERVEVAVRGADWGGVRVRLEPGSAPAADVVVQDLEGENDAGPTSLRVSAGAEERTPAIGRVQVRAWAPGHAVWLREVRIESEAEVLVPIRLSREARVRVRAVAPGGAARAGALIASLAVPVEWSAAPYEVERGLGTSPADMRTPDAASDGPPTVPPGEALFEGVPPGPFTASIAGRSASGVARAGETVEVTIPVSGDAADAADPAPGPPGKATLYALVVDEVRRPLPAAVVILRREGADPVPSPTGAGGSASWSSVPPGPVRLRACTQDRPEGPAVDVTVPDAYEDVRVLLTPGPPEERAGIEGRVEGLAAWRFATPSVVVAVAPGAEGGARDLLLEPTHDGHFTSDTLPAGVPLRLSVAMKSGTRSWHVERGETAPGEIAAAHASVTLSTGERRAVTLRAAPPARIHLGRGAGAVIVDAATDRALDVTFEGAVRGTTLDVWPGTYRVGLATKGDPAGVFRAVQAAALASGQEWTPQPAPVEGDASIGGWHRLPAAVADAAGVRWVRSESAWLVGPGVLVRLTPGAGFSLERAPAGRYAVRVAGREVRSFEVEAGEAKEVGWVP